MHNDGHTLMKGLPVKATYVTDSTVTMMTDNGVIPTDGDVAETQRRILGNSCADGCV